MEIMHNLPSMEELMDMDKKGKAVEVMPEVEIDDEDGGDFEPNYGDLSNLPASTSRSELVMSGMPLQDHDDSMDTIHDETLKHAQDLMDYGYSAEPRSQATLFEKANMLYKTALDAKATKIDAHLKIRKLMLDQKKLELEEKKLNHEMGNKTADMEAEATVIFDRNDMVRKLREDAKRERLEAGVPEWTPEPDDGSD
jgi:hypothetical protein